MALNRSAAVALLFIALFYGTQVSGRFLLQQTATASAQASLVTNAFMTNANAVANAVVTGGTGKVAARANAMAFTGGFQASGGASANAGLNTNYLNNAGGGLGAAAVTNVNVVANTMGQGALMGGGSIQAMAAAAAKVITGMNTAQSAAMVNAMTTALASYKCPVMQPLFVAAKAAATATTVNGGAAAWAKAVVANSPIEQCIGDGNGGNGGGGATAMASAQAMINSFGGEGNLADGS